MKNPSRSTNLAIGAIVLVVLPLLVTIAALAANLALESTGAEVSVVGRFGTAQAILIGWSVVAIGVVGALAAAVFEDQPHA